MRTRRSRRHKEAGHFGGLWKIHLGYEQAQSNFIASGARLDKLGGCLAIESDAGQARQSMITEYISKLAVKILDTTGYTGACGLMALESMIAPVPSEAVMPFVGFQVADGRWNLWLAILSTSIGSIIGSLLSYWMGYYGGKPLVLKVGKYLFLNRHDLEMTERFFHQRRGVWTIFIGRFIPVIRHFISIPAGMGRMPLLPFLAVTLVGATMWNTFLLVCGMKLREHWTVVQKYSHQVDIVVVVLAIIGLAWFLRLRAVRAKRVSAPGSLPLN
ncbi:MAG: DedA family protein [Verrucomicrobiales bacterium]|nr:DedA family protein [Verrucomicrobiales bacterium]